MEKEPRQILVTFGENVHFLEGKNYIEKRATKTHPIQDIVSEAAGNKMYYDYQHAQLWAVGGDTTGIGISEAEQIEKTAQDASPEIHFDVRKIEEPMDTYFAAEAVKKELDTINHEVEVSTIFPIAHRFRANQQLKQQGVRINKKYWAEPEYINRPHSTAKDRNERRKELSRILVRPNIYFDLVREVSLYMVGFIDRKGRLMRNVSNHFRKYNPNSKINKEIE